MDQEFKNIREVVTFLKEQGWKVAQSSIYDHAQRGIIRPNRKGIFTEKVVRQYARDYLRVQESGMTEKKSKLIDQKHMTDIALKMQLLKTAKRKDEILDRKYVERAAAEQEVIGRLALIEAQFKAKIQLAAGDLVSGIALGSVSIKPDSRTYKLLKQSLQILVAIDFDKAGAGAWPWWKEHFPDCERWPVSKAKDPGDAFKAGVDVREWVKAGLPSVFSV